MSESSSPPKTDSASANNAALSTNTVEAAAAIHFHEWKPLGGPVTLTLAPRRTVLVGRNGGGKSLLLEGMYRATSNPAFHILRQGHISECTWDIQMTNGRVLHYQYQFEPSPSEIRAKTEPAFSWAEKCWIDSVETPMWSSRDGVLRFDNGEQISIAVNQSPLSVRNLSEKLLIQTNYMQLLLQYFNEFISLTAWTPRTSFARKDVFSSTDLSQQFRPDSELEPMVKELYGIWHDSPELFREINDVGKRIGLWKKMEVDIYNGKSKSKTDSIVAILIDGINLGRVSDGTLRTLEILIPLIDSRPKTKPTILIDEPEIGIHPGLLAKLLAEFDAYGADRQLVIATHSPQVVSWAQPSELRLVERVEGRTVVQPLSDEQAARVQSYLQDQGSLGEFVYGGGTDQ